MSRIFARALTKEELIKNGVKEITEDCKVIFEDGRVLEKEEDFSKTKKGYLTFYVYELDENGNKIKKPAKKRYKAYGYYKTYNGYNYKIKTISLHRAMFAWHYNEVPEGLVIDHINNKHDTLYDNRLENLQLISQRENAVKDRTLSTHEISCNMNWPLSHYENKLNTYIKDYNNAKDKEEKHSLRSCICQYKAKIRYWKSHEEEYIKNEETKALKSNANNAQKERAKDLKQYQKLVDEARELYKQDPSSDNNYNWRLAVSNYNEYVKNNPFKTQKQLFVELDDEQVRN